MVSLRSIATTPSIALVIVAYKCLNTCCAVVHICAIVHLSETKQFTYHPKQMIETTIYQDFEPIEAEVINNSPNTLVNSSDNLVNGLFEQGKPFTPLTRREFAIANNITPAYVGQLVKRLAKIWEPIDPNFTVLTTDDKITSNAQQELLAMIAQKPAKYQKRVWAEYSYDPNAQPQTQPQQNVRESSALAVTPCARSRFSQWEQAIATSESQIEAIDVEFVDSQTAQSTALDTYSIARERIERLQAAATHNRETSNATFLNQVAADALKLKAQADQLRELILSGQLDASALAAMGLTEGSDAAKSPN